MLKLISSDFCTILEILRKKYSNDLAVCLTEYITSEHLYYDNEYNDNDFCSIFFGFKDYYLEYKKKLEQELEHNRDCEYWEYTFDSYKRCVNSLIEFDEEWFYSNRFNCFEEIYFDKSKQIDKIITRLSPQVNRYKNPSRGLRDWEGFEQHKKIALNNFELLRKIKVRFNDESKAYKGK